MPKLQVFFGDEQISPKFSNVLHYIKELSEDNFILLAEEDGNGEARITRDCEGWLFVEAPNNQREDLTFLTQNTKAAYDAAKTIIAAYFQDKAA